MSIPPALPLDLGAVLAQPRDYVGNRFVYAVITSRARGLSIGVNMNPDQRCNFDCPYCEVKRLPKLPRQKVDLKVLNQELTQLLTLAQTRRFHTLPPFSNVPPDLLELKEVALSGDGEPSQAANFDAIVAEVLKIRRLLGPFKVVLITNGTGLHRPSVRRGIDLFAENDEIWIKLDAGTDAYMQRINGTDVPVESIVENIIAVGRERPVIIQSLFCLLNNEPPAEAEIDAYIQRLRTIKESGAQVSLVQVYSLMRPPARPGCKHLPLATLSRIARRVRTETGLRSEVF